MIIRSLLDNDLYKFSMQKAVLRYRQGVPVRYVFNNRRPEGKFNQAFFEAFNHELWDELPRLQLTMDECRWLKSRLPWLGSDYIEYLANYRFHPQEVNAKLHEGELQLEIEGPWERTILWEVPLMALISELYFIHCDTGWKQDESEQRIRTQVKGEILKDQNYSDFGTRRRRSYDNHRLVVQQLKSMPGFAGTSNVHLARIFDVRPVGTMAHEWIMGISALESLRHANRYALKIWSEVYGGNLGIALTDTFGTDAFFRDFDGYLARLFDGVRHDSGEPLEFAEKTIAAYRALGIRPEQKTIVFSDGLTAEIARTIGDQLRNKIRAIFGIGTHFTNDYPGSRALNMVIKLCMCAGIPVVKLSDIDTKAIGDPDALRVARWTFFNTPLGAIA